MDGSNGFRAALGRGRTFDDPTIAVTGPSVVPAGSLPAPFDQLDGPGLAGPTGSHPLALLTAADLLRSATGGLVGTIELDGPVRVGEGITGHIRVQAQRPIRARAANLRLIGVMATEDPRSGPSRAADAANAASAAAAAAAAAAIASRASAPVPPGGSAPAMPVPAPTQPDTSTVSWVEVHGRIIEDSRFTEPVLPLELATGAVVDLPFQVPAPRLGPPSVHAGIALVAWALEAHWDVAMGADAAVSVVVPLAQHPDLLRSGAMTLPAGALFDVVQDEGAALTVAPLPPLVAGAPVTLSIAWPSAPGGRSARVELTTDVHASTSSSVVSVSLAVDHDALAGTQLVVPLPPDLPSTLAMDGLHVNHRLRVIVDRKMRSDVTAQRAIAVL